MKTFSFEQFQVKERGLKGRNEIASRHKLKSQEKKWRRKMIWNLRTSNDHLKPERSFFLLSVDFLWNEEKEVISTKALLFFLYSKGHPSGNDLNNMGIKCIYIYFYLPFQFIISTMRRVWIERNIQKKRIGSGNQNAHQKKWFLFVFFFISFRNPFGNGKLLSKDEE